MNNADALITTCYGPVSQGFIDRAAKIRLRYPLRPDFRD